MKASYGRTVEQDAAALGIDPARYTVAGRPGKPKVLDFTPVAEKPKAKACRKVSHVTGRMNKLEAAMSYELDAMKQAGIVKRWRFESVKLRLADNTWYTVDFEVLLTDGRTVMLETKGFCRDDAAVKFKVAREHYTEYLWIMYRRIKGRWVRHISEPIDIFQGILESKG